MPEPWKGEYIVLIRFKHKATQNSVVKWQVLYKIDGQYALMDTACHIEDDTYTLILNVIDESEENASVIVIWDDYVAGDNLCCIKRYIEMYRISNCKEDKTIIGYSDDRMSEYANVQIIEKENSAYTYYMPSIDHKDTRSTYKVALVQAIIPEAGLLSPYIDNIDIETACSVFGFYDEKRIDRACVIIKEDI